MGILNKAFFHIGYASASHPFASLFGGLFFTVVFGLGFLNFRLTVRYEDPYYIG